MNNTVNDEPGNFGKGNLGLGYLGVSRSIEDPELRKKKLGAELANGRLATTHSLFISVPLSLS